MPLSRAKRLVFAAITVCGSVALTLSAVLAADLYLHHKYGETAGFNIRGYRGPLVGRKEPGERRIVVLGGSSAMGYGLRPHEAFPAQLERSLNARPDRPSATRYRVINLAWNSEGAYSFQHTLEDYRDLKYELAILYEGYNDLYLEANNTRVFRHDSAMFRMTGYLPILPIILREKAMALRYGGNLEAAYRHQATVFRPRLAQQATASALETAAHISQSLGRQLGHLSKRSEPGSDTAWADVGEGTADCAPPWGFYCQSVSAAVERALERGVAVIVATQPYISDDHVDQQQALAGMLRTRFGAQPGFRYVNLGWTVPLSDPALAYDGMHLSSAGNGRIAEALAGPVAELLGSAGGS